MALKYLSVCVVFLVIRGSVQDSHNHGQQTQFQNHDENHDDCLDQDEFKSIFMAMDTNPRDNRLTISEVSAGWHRFHFSDYSDVTFFFMEMDINRDTYITQSDLDFLFSTFDSSNEGCVSSSEYNLSWNSLFNE